MRKLRRFTGGRLFPCALLALFFAIFIGTLSIFLPRVLAPVAVCGLLFSLVSALVTAAADEPAEYKISKLVLILLLPWTGAALALWWRYPRTALPPVAAKRAEGVRGRVFALGEKCGLAPAGACDIRYFPVGKEMCESLLADLKKAKRSVFLEYYIIAYGVFYSAVLRILADKARDGLDVRILYDDFGCSLTLPRDFAQTLSKMGIKARAYGKLRFPTRAAGRRDHRKIAVIDGTVAYTGGINLADEYIGARIRFGHWKDAAVRVEGEPADRFARLFCEHWNKADPAEPLHFQEKAQNAVCSEIPCSVFADGTDSGERVGKEILTLLVSSAERTLFCTTPYLAPDAPLLSALKTAAGSGVDVRILIPHVPDKRLPFALTRSYARELLRAGVQVREYAAGFLHAKNLVSDGKYAVVSTYNLDFRSLWVQAECGLFAESAAFAEAVRRDFLSDWETGVPVKKASFPARAGAAILRLFAPLI